MNQEQLARSFPEYLARCGARREDIRVLSEPVLQTMPVVEAEHWWESGALSLLLIGGVGPGKTIAGLSLFRRNWRAVPVYLYQPGDLPAECRWRSGAYVDMADLSTRGLFDDDAKMLRHRAQESELAILDDAGTERGDGAQAIGSIFMARHGAGRRTIITANLTPALAKERIGDRVLDRILGNGRIVNCGNKSLRIT